MIEESQQKLKEIVAYIDKNKEELKSVKESGVYKDLVAASNSKLMTIAFLSILASSGETNAKAVLKVILKKHKVSYKNIMVCHKQELIKFVKFFISRIN